MYCSKTLLAVYVYIYIYTVAERAQRAVTSENMQTEKTPANQETSSSVWQQVVQMLTTQPNKEFDLQRVSLFGCVVSICSACVFKLIKYFS